MAGDDQPWDKGGDDQPWDKGGDDQPWDKGLLRQLFGSASGDGDKGLMFIGWIAPASLDDFRKLLCCDPERVQALADQLKEKGEKMKEAEAARKAAGTKKI